MMSAALKLIPFALVFSAAVALGAQSREPPQSPSESSPQSPPESPPQIPPSPGPAIGLADSAGLRATVFGTPPQDLASLDRKSVV